MKRPMRFNHTAVARTSYVCSAVLIVGRGIDSGGHERSKFSISEKERSRPGYVGSRCPSGTRRNLRRLQRRERKLVVDAYIDLQGLLVSESDQQDVSHGFCSI